MATGRKGRRASITDLASDTTDTDFYVVEVGKSGAIVRHFTHPQHCAKILAAQSNQLVTQREIKAACDAEVLGIKSDILGRRFAWAAKYVVPEGAEVDDDDQDEAMKERLRKMSERQEMMKPELKPEVEPEYNPNETLDDVRAENAAAVLEIKRLRQELEAVESGVASTLLPTATSRELEELSVQHNKVDTLDASLDAQLHDMGRQQALASSRLKQSKERIREKDVELKKLRAAVQELEARAMNDVRKAREMELEIQVVRSRRQSAAKMMKQLEAKTVISKNHAQIAHEDAVAERKQEDVNRQALEHAQRGLAAKGKEEAVIEEAQLSKELVAEKKRRAAVRQETKEMRKQLARKERDLLAKEEELATKVHQASAAQRSADGQFLEAQQLFDHSNLVLAAQSRRMMELARRRESAEHKLARLSPRRDGRDREDINTTAVSQAKSSASVEATADVGSRHSTEVVSSSSITEPAAVVDAVTRHVTSPQAQQLPPTPKTPLRAGLHVLVRQQRDLSSTDISAGDEATRKGRIMQVSPSRERCSVVFSDGDVAQDIPIELIERQESELLPKLQHRFASDKTLEQKVVDKRHKARGREKIQLAGSGAAAAQATLIKHAPSLSFLRVLSTTERMQYFQEDVNEGKRSPDGAKVDS